MFNKIDVEYEGQRLDAVLAQLFPEYSRTRLSKWLKSGEILVDGQLQKPRFLVSGGEKIELKTTETPLEKLPWSAEPISLNIIHQDSDILIINKPAGLVVHPGAGNWQGTLVNGLLNFDTNLKTLPRAGIVHRLDKDTSGLLVVARNIVAHTSLIRQLEARTVDKEYFAVVNGVLTAGGLIDYPIGRHKTKRVKMAVIANGKEAITHYRVAERFRSHSAITVKIETGRTHQIRVHMAHKKMPLIGDKLYGGRIRMPKGCTPEFQTTINGFKRQALHALNLGFIHPRTEQFVRFHCELPDDIKQLLSELRQDQVVHND